MTRFLPQADDVSADGRRGGVFLNHPVHRGIVAVSMEHEATRTNPVREELRKETFRLLEMALRTAGIPDRLCDSVTDRGDALVFLIRPVDEVPKTLFLDTVIPTLRRLVHEHNAGQVACDPQRRLRLRAVVHAGEVHYDGQGCFGEALDVAFRLLDAPRVRVHARAARDPLVLVISEEIYWSIVRHGYAGIERSEFMPLVRIHAGRRRQGWVHIGSFRDSYQALADSGAAPTR